MSNWLDSLHTAQEEIAEAIYQIEDTRNALARVGMPVSQELTMVMVSLKNAYSLINEGIGKQLNESLEASRESHRSVIEFMSEVIHAAGEGRIRVGGE